MKITKFQMTSDRMNLMLNPVRSTVCLPSSEMMKLPDVDALMESDVGQLLFGLVTHVTAAVETSK